MLTTTNIPGYRKKYEHLSVDERLQGTTETLAGRIYNVRGSSKNLIFVDLVGGSLSADVPLSDLTSSNHIQIMLNKREYGNDEEFVDVRTNRLLRGNIIKVTGFPARTKTGELSLIAQSLVVLAKCEVPMPHELKDPYLRATQRYYDLIVNRETSLPRYVARSRTISALRNFLESRLGMVEVETAVLSSKASGATAKPFVTHHNALDTNCFLRIAPELNLKRLIVGGFDGVFEIGKQFRNEDVDLTHNPEFTSCEFYRAYSNYEELMPITEEILSTIARTVTGGTVTRYNGTEINWAGPYRRIDVMEELQKHCGDIPDVSDTAHLDKLCKDHSIACSEPRTASRLLDKLISTYIEPQCVQPTFVIGHPAIMCPLAKKKPETELTERFELFVCGKELCNAYSELNDPAEQLARFTEQAKDKAAGDDEIGDIDHDFINALKFGMPPTAGWGLGIDRFVMMLTDAESIRDVILFPATKAVELIPYVFLDSAEAISS